jgi:hypothetical protein
MHGFRAYVSPFPHTWTRYLPSAIAVLGRQRECATTLYDFPSFERARARSEDERGCFYSRDVRVSSLRNYLENDSSFVFLLGRNYTSYGRNRAARKSVTAATRQFLSAER